MRILKWAAIYFTIVFGVGFGLGVVRVLWVVPRWGVRTAELLEMPWMLMAIVLAARWMVAQGDDRESPRVQLGVGGLALGLLLLAEVLLSMGLRGRSLFEAVVGFVDRDPVSGTVYYLLLGVFALLPWWLSRRQ